MPRVIAYIRVSTERQDADNQLTGIRQYAEREHLHIDDVVGETASGFKVKLTERKFSDVLDDLKAGDTLIVSETSRISRKLLDVLNTIQLLLDRGVNVIAVKEGMVFKDDINSKVIAFAFGLAAEIERNMISQRTKEALARLKAEGVVLGRPVGTGKPEHYKLHGRDEEIKALMRSRVSMSAIARLMGVNRQTVYNYVAKQRIRQELLLENAHLD